MSNDDFFDKLMQADTEAERAAIIALSVIDDLPAFERDVARLASSLRWFDGDIIKALCLEIDPASSPDQASAVYKTIQELPFVEAVPNVGHRLHAQTAEGLIQNLSEENPDLVQLAHKIASEAWLEAWEDDYIAQSAVYALFASNQTELAVEKFNELRRRFVGAGDWEKLLKLFDLRKKDTFPPFAVLPDLTDIDYFFRGLAYDYLKDYERAIADYDRAIELNPEDATAYNNRGNSYSNQGDEERAIADYDRAIELNPEEATAYNNRGHSYS
ncbi:MAG: tetratricopeptide (TPR) repeat protein, partial [Cellvibrionaceae bacterium]